MEINDYLRGELEIVPEYVKRELLRSIKTIGDFNKNKLFKDDENIDGFLKRFLQENESDFKQAHTNILLNKGYKYSALFKLDDERSIDEIVESLSSNDEITNELATPVQELKATSFSNTLIIPFVFQGAKVVDNEIKRYKTTYSALVNFHVIDQKKFLEIDVDNIATYFRNGREDFFTYIINKISEWIETVGLLAVQPVDLVEVLEKFKEEGEGLSYPKASAQKMVLSTGSQAILDSADAEEILLPILGELKILITDNQLLFDQAPEIQRLLEDFIRETEIEAELPWMTFTWDNKVKSKKVQVKFIFSDTPYTLLSYYTHTKGRSGMRDVIESLLKKYCEIENSRTTVSS